jgi:hypothetical protein
MQKTRPIEPDLGVLTHKSITQEAEQEDGKFEASMGYTASSQMILTIWVRFCLKKRKEGNKEGR